MTDLAEIEAFENLFRKLAKEKGKTHVGFKAIIGNGNKSFQISAKKQGIVMPFIWKDDAFEKRHDIRNITECEVYAIALVPIKSLNKELQEEIKKERENYGY